jgi:hypothetical protein
MQIASLALCFVSYIGEATFLTYCHVVDGILQGACLLTHRQLDIAVHGGNVVVGLAAAFCQLGSDCVVTLHDGSQYLISSHAHLVADTANLLAYTIDGSDNVTGSSVESSSERLNIEAIALNCLHDNSRIGIVIEHNATLSVRHQATAIVSTEEVASTHKKEEKQDGKQTITPSVSIALAVAESKQTWIYTLSLHKCWEHSENAIETTALAGSVLPEYVSF